MNRNQDKYNQKYKNPLYSAVENNSKDIFEILLLKGANISGKDTLYQIILLLFFINIISNLERRLNIMNSTLLHFAAEKNSKDIGELLISKGADINAIDILLDKCNTLILT